MALEHLGRWRESWFKIKPESRPLARISAVGENLVSRYSFERIVDVARVFFVLQMQASSGNLEADIVSLETVEACLNVCSHLCPISPNRFSSRLFFHSLLSVSYGFVQVAPLDL